MRILDLTQRECCKIRILTNCYIQYELEDGESMVTGEGESKELLLWLANKMRNGVII